VLEGDESLGYGPERIVITAIGREVTAVIMQNSGQLPKYLDHGTEGIFYLDRRDWRKVGHMDPFADELVWP
jgi:hypothetical protein